jgi:SRSO17 transposase
VDDSTTTQPRHWAVTARLYLPQRWAQDPARCRQAQVPEAVDFASKPKLARHLLEQARSWGVPFATVVTDAGDGIPSFLRALDARQIPDVCTVAYDFGVRLPADRVHATAEPAAAPVRRRGQPKKPRPVPRHTAQALTADQPDAAWQTVDWREGSRGALRKQVVALRVHAGTGSARHSATHGRSWTGPEGWLLGERPLPGEDGEPRWFLSSLPADTPLPRLIARAPICAGRLSNSTKLPKGHVGWTSFRDAPGKDCTATWHWCCWPIPS